MARKLSSKQIEILKGYSDVTDFDDLPQHVQDDLEKYNDYETLYQDANRFLSDQFFSMRNADGSLQHKRVIH